MKSSILIFDAEKFFVLFFCVKKYFDIEYYFDDDNYLVLIII